MKKMIKSPFPCLVSAVIPLLIAVAGPSCSQLKPVAAPPAADLSGTYLYHGLGDRKAYQFPNPLIDFADIRERCEIRVEHAAGILEARYPDRAGHGTIRKLDLAQLPDGVRWTGGVLETKWREASGGGFILPGAAVQHRGSMIRRADDGGLVIDGFFTEKGAALFLVPFSDRDDYRLLLKRKR